MRWRARTFTWLATGLLAAYCLLAFGLSLIPREWVDAAVTREWAKPAVEWLMAGLPRGWIHPVAGWLALVAAGAMWVPDRRRLPAWLLPILGAVLGLMLVPLLVPGLRPDTPSTLYRLLWAEDAMDWPIALVATWLVAFVAVSQWPRPLTSWLVTLLSYLMMSAAAFGVASNYLKLDLIYQQPLFAPVKVSLAVILFLLGLILLLRRQSLMASTSSGNAREDSLISSIGLGLLVTIAFSTGLSSFIALQSQVEESLYRGQIQSMDNRIIVFYNAMDAAYSEVSAVSRNIEVARLLAELDDPAIEATDDKREQLLTAVASNLPFNVGGYEFRSPGGKVLARRGTRVKAETIWVEYRDTTEVRLDWFNGIPFIGMTIRINDADGAKIGELVVELPTQDWEQLATDTYDLGRTGNMMICGVEAEVLRCLQSHAKQSLYSPPENTELTTMVQDALEGERSPPTVPRITRNEDGKPIVVTYGPVGKVRVAIKAPGIGLAMLILTDAEEFYEPVRLQLQKILPLLLGIIIVGGVILRRLVVPLIRALRDKEARFRELTELSSDCYWQMDVNLRFVEITGVTLISLGIRMEDWLGRDITEVPATVDVSADGDALAALKAALSNKEAFYEVTFRVPEADASGMHFLSLSGAPLYDEKGEFIGYRGVGKNITPRKLAEEGLREAQQGLEIRVEERTAELSASNTKLAVEVQERTHAEARFRSLTELSSDWYWEMNTDYRFVQISGEVERKGGFSAADGLGKALWEQSWVRAEENNWTELRRALDACEPFYEYTVKTRDFEDAVRYLAISGQPFHDAENVFVGFRGTGKDVTEKRLAEEHIHFLAHFDSLTNLPNRAFLNEQVRFAIERAKRHKKKLALLFIDLDRFKVINDSLGHDAGDEVLRIVARRITECVRDSDMVSRLGGDEFVVLLEDIFDSNHAGVTARRILDLINEPFHLVGEPYTVGASIGISLFPDDGDSISELLKHSDAAMYLAKKDGRNGIYFFSSSLNDTSMAVFRLESDLRQALEQEQFILHYQPKVNPVRKEIVGVEALIRWRHPTRGMVSPLEFIPMAEECGLIVAIGEWVLNKALAELAIWDQAGLSPLTMSVNLSPRQLQDNLPEVLEKALKLHGLPTDRLELELTESLLLQRPERDIRLLEHIQNTGVRIALDDFGTGFSSLSSLATLPIDCVKMDRAFVERLPVDATSTAISRSILTMARGIGLEVVAEGVETVEQWDWLAQEGCHQIQGYYFSKPLPPEEAFAFISAFEAKRRLGEDEPFSLTS